jgi:hypothetical protein
MNMYIHTHIQLVNIILLPFYPKMKWQARYVWVETSYSALVGHVCLYMHIYIHVLIYIFLTDWSGLTNQYSNIDDLNISNSDDNDYNINNNNGIMCG